MYKNNILRLSHLNIDIFCLQKYLVNIAQKKKFVDPTKLFGQYGVKQIFSYLTKHIFLHIKSQIM